MRERVMPDSLILDDKKFTNDQCGDFHDANPLDTKEVSMEKLQRCFYNPSIFNIL